ncbi:uncharacterized protein [Pithys albifrons albifrons]|uniref:uncharacterized protein isoform X1 n=1 Tax=Pithys albifrons albifrons TaxID=3385563 RepID=UPI003A5CDA1D
MATEPVPRQSGTEAGRALEQVPAATAGAGPEKQFCCSWEESGPGEVNPELPVEPGRDAGAGTVRGGGADCGVWREKRLKLRGLCLFPAVPSGSPGLQGIPLASCLLSLQPGVLGGFLKLIALKASDPQAFDLLNSIMEHMPPESQLTGTGNRSSFCYSKDFQVSNQQNLSKKMMIPEIQKESGTS